MTLFAWSAIGNLDDDPKSALQLAAARDSRSIEDEALIILRHALMPSASDGLDSRIRERFRSSGGVNLEFPERIAAPRSADFD